MKQTSKMSTLQRSPNEVHFRIWTFRSGVKIVFTAPFNVRLTLVLRGMHANHGINNFFPLWSNPSTPYWMLIYKYEIECTIWNSLTTYLHLGAKVFGKIVRSALSRQHARTYTLHHKQLLKHWVHIARRSCVLQTNETTLRPRTQRGKVVPLYEWLIPTCYIYLIWENWFRTSK